MFKKIVDEFTQPCEKNSIGADNGKRLQHIDLFKYIALLSIMVVHVRPFEVPAMIRDTFHSVSFAFLNQSVRYGVPFFFIMSGYFWGLKVWQEGQPVLLSVRRSRRLMGLFFIWSFIYLCIKVISAGETWDGAVIIKNLLQNIAAISRLPLFYLFNGTKTHLWFLPALVSALLLIPLFVKYNKIIHLVIFSIAVYTIGVLGGHIPILLWGLTALFFCGMDLPSASYLLQPVIFYRV